MISNLAACYADVNGQVWPEATCANTYQTQYIAGKDHDGVVTLRVDRTADWDNYNKPRGLQPAPQ